MTYKGLLKSMVAGVAFVIACACGSSKEVVDPKVMLAYGKEPNEQNMEALSKSYGNVISKSRKSGMKEPGVYSDYAVMLVKQGKRAEANGWFNKEMEAFPSSRGYVMQLKRRLIPEYQDNNSTNMANTDPAEAEAKPAATDKTAKGKEPASSAKGKKKSSKKR